MGYDPNPFELRDDPVVIEDAVACATAAENARPGSQLELALHQAELGRYVFPCKPDKAPHTISGFYDASRDPAVIRGWWERWPDAVVGVRTGEVSGFLIIDADVLKQDDFDADEKYLREKGEPSKKPRVLPGEKLGDPIGEQTLRAMGLGHIIETAAFTATPSGGKHMAFAYPSGLNIRSRNSKFGRKIDVKSQDGYIVLYADMPAELPAVPYDVLAVLIQLEAPRQPNPAPVNPYVETMAPRPVPDEADGRRAHAYAEAALQGEVKALAEAMPGTRNGQLNIAALKLGQLVSAGLLDRAKVERHLTAAANECGLGAVETARTIRSGIEAGMKQPRKIPERAEEQRHRRREPPKREGSSSQSVGSNSDAEPDTIPFGYDLTEDGIALAFAARHVDVLRYCRDHGAWFEWVGTHWQKQRTRRAFAWARDLCREMNRENKTSLAKIATAAAVEKGAQADQRLEVIADIWDQNLMLLGTPEGPIDLKSGLLLPPERDHFITKLTAVAPAPAGTPHPTWSRFLHDVTLGDTALQRFLQQIAGYALTGLTIEHIVIFIYGPGGNGKSVFLNVLSHILGDYARVAAMTTFMASKTDSHPTDLAHLLGARLVSVSETEEGRAWAEAKIKRMTGGEKVPARFMRENYFEYMPAFKLVIVGNHKPVLQNVDDAARRRFNIIPFVHKPPQPDPHLEEKLRAEYPAILRWMVDGCLDWQANGLVRPTVVTEATQNYFDEQNTFQQWIDECCICGANHFDTVTKLFGSWSVWAKAQNEDPRNTKVFAQNLIKAGFRQTKHTPGANGKRGFLGISVLREAAQYWGDAA